MTDAPAQNLQAEESVLGACLVSGNAIERVLDEGLAYTDFYRHHHGTIFQAVCRLFDANEPVDGITLSAELERQGKLAEVGGQGRISELVALVPATSNAGHYAKIVKETAGMRRLLSAGQQIARLGTEGTGDLDALIAQAETVMTEAVRPSSQAGSFVSLADELADLAAQIEDAMKSGKPRFGLKTGFPVLDEALTGLHPGQLILVAARPAMGKSALAQNIAENVVDAGGNAALNSLEMSKAEVLLRSLSRASRIDTKRLRTGQIGSAEVDRFFEAKKKVGERTGLFVDDNSGVTLPQLRAALKRLHRKEPLSIAVLDYIGLMLSAKTEDNRQQEVSAISRGLKLLARELGIPIVALSQLNRNLESRPDKRPVLSDLRDSGALEQDADVVLFVYRDEYYNPGTEKVGMAEIIVAKNRMGEATTVELAFSGRQTSFLPLRAVEQKKEAA